MKKFSYLALIIAFSFLLTGSVSAVVSENGNANLRSEEVKERGLDNAASRIEAVIRKIEGMGKDIDINGLRNALENIFRRRESRYCYEIEEGLEFEDEGEEVEVLQKALQKEGFYKGRERVYGWDTAKAVYEYQEENDIDLSKPMEKMGFELSEETRKSLNEKYDCEDLEDEDEEEDEEEEDNNEEEDENEDEEEGEEEDDSENDDNE
jgi:hypothetical protein